MGEPNFANRTLYHGDNLPFLQGMNSETVHLIATDPPFNKNRDFHATPDSLAAGAKFTDRWSWERDVHEDWVDSIKDDWPGVWSLIETSRVTFGDDMGAFLCWLGVRCMEMHRILREDGSFYLHIDDLASAYVKALLDAIFGSENFRNELTWRRATSHNDAKRYGRIVDHIFYYVKSDKACWNGRAINVPKSEEELANTYPSKDGRGRYRSSDLTGAGVSSGASGEPWGKYEVSDKGRHWAVPKSGRYAEYIEKHFIPGYRSMEGVHERLDALDAAGLIHHPTRGVWPGLKRYADADQGNPPQNLILRPIGFTNFSSSRGEYTGFPTQKPLGLYERFIRASSNPGDVVLDPFCGCATTPVAAERLGRQWVGIDIWDGAHKMVLERLEQETRKSMAWTEKVHYSTTPPVRTDDNEAAAPVLRLKLQRATEPWQRLSHRQIFDCLKQAQASMEGVVCGGCGRALEEPFMQLDHIQPRAEGGANDITNRILLCGPCNRKKGADLTLRGLVRANKRDGWMQSEGRATMAQNKARQAADQIRYGTFWDLGGL